MDTVSGLNVALVDHSEYEHSAEGLESAYIVAIIDHHGDGSVRTGNQLLYEAKALGSTATIIWEKYRDYGVEPDKETACAMIGSIFSDTHKLEYATTTFADEEAVRDAFGEGMDFDGISYVLSPSISRKTVLVPAIEEALKNTGKNK